MRKADTFLLMTIGAAVIILAGLNLSQSVIPHALQTSRQFDASR